jgi:hypothetical protein
MRYTPSSEPKLGKTQADFTYSIRGEVISIIDLDLGNRSVTNDIENVLRKIEYWHQGSIAAFRIMYRDSGGVWDGVNWDDQRASFFALGETDETAARRKTFYRSAREKMIGYSHSYFLIRILLAEGSKSHVGVDCGDGARSRTGFDRSTFCEGF